MNRRPVTNYLLHPKTAAAAAAALDAIQRARPLRPPGRLVLVDDDPEPVTAAQRDAAAAAKVAPRLDLRRV